VIRHLQLDIRGALRWSVDELGSLGFTGEDGSEPSGEEVREYLLDHLQQGHRFLPMSQDCEGFSHETECPGHEAPKKEP
jgi:hypothetical protein